MGKKNGPESHESSSRRHQNPKCGTRFCLMDCRHIDSGESFNPELVTAKIKDTKECDWFCLKCKRETDSSWLCLGCGIISCGRFEKGHGELHYKETGHALALDLITKACHCYSCDDYVQVVSEQNEFELDSLRKLITFINSGIQLEAINGTIRSPRRLQKFAGITGLKNLG